MHALFAVALIAAPEPLFHDSWFSSVLDFPERGVKPNELTLIAAQMTIDKGGAVVTCSAKATMGNPNMAPYTCARLKDRALFKPARDATGRKTYGVVREFIAWWAGDQAPPEIPTGDFAVRLGELPADVKPDTETSIVFAVDELGRMSTCSPRDKDANAAVAAAACPQVSARLKLAPAYDRRERPVASVQSAKVTVLGAFAPY